MQTEEDVEADYYYNYFNEEGDIISFSPEVTDSAIVYPGYIPRPTDQRLNVGLFFQDYFPGNDSYKMHLTLLYGTGLPFGPPNTARHKATLRMPDYKRVDIGFSKVIKREKKEQIGKNFFRYFKSIWLTAEVFNLLGVNNTVSYLWVTVVPNDLNPSADIHTQYAVPNFLTARRLNLKLIAKF
jgi:hypothetical protein